MTKQKIQFFFITGLTFIFAVVGSVSYYSLKKPAVMIDDAFQVCVAPVEHLRVISELYSVDILGAFNQCVNEEMYPAKAYSIIKKSRKTVLIHWEAYLNKQKSEDLIGKNELAVAFETKMRQMDASLSEISEELRHNNMDAVKKYLNSELYGETRAMRLLLTQMIDGQFKFAEDRLEAIKDVFLLYRTIAISGILLIFIFIVVAHFIFDTMTRRCLLVASREMRSICERKNLTHRLSVGGDSDVAKIAGDVNTLLDVFMDLHEHLKQSINKIPGVIVEITKSLKLVNSGVGKFQSFANDVFEDSDRTATISRRILDDANDVINITSEASSLAVTSQKGAGQIELSMFQIQNASAEISSKLAVINEKTDNINAFVVTIVKVAEQTNVLSFNASIEAEKAGEYGLGFAVVAREIRRLADQVATASSEIGGMVEEMRSAVSAGVMEMDKFTVEVCRRLKDVKDVGATLDKVVERITVLTPKFEDLSATLMNQVDSIKQIEDSAKQLTGLAKETKGSVQNVRDGVGQLGDVAEEIRSNDE